MAIHLITKYAKRLGLPGFSSHEFSVSCDSECSDINQIPGEVTRHFEQLQAVVDKEIRSVGFVPPKDYGSANGRDNENGSHNRLQSAAVTSSNGREWACSDKQKELILTLVTENNISRDAVDSTAHDRFGVGVKELNKLQASGLITELLETTGKSNGGRNGSKVAARKGGGK